MIRRPPSSVFLSCTTFFRSLYLVLAYRLISSYPTMTVASIRALHELLSNVPPATSSSCSSLTVSGFWISSLILGFGWWVCFGSIGLSSELTSLCKRTNRLLNDPATTEFCVLVLHDVLPISLLTVGLWY